MNPVSVDLHSVATKLANRGFTPPDVDALMDRVRSHYDNGEPDSPPGIIFLPSIRNLQADLVIASGPITVQAQYRVHQPRAGRPGPQITVLKVENLRFH